MELTDGRVVLRPPGPDDSAFVVEAATDEDVVDITSVPPHADEAAAREWLERLQQRLGAGDGWAFLIVDAGEPVGFVGLWPDALRETGQVGYWLLARARGRGLAAASLRLVVAHAFDELGLHRVQALIEPWNEASIRVALHAGLRREGLLRGYFKHRDVYMYAVLAGDPRPF